MQDSIEENIKMSGGGIADFLEHGGFVGGGIIFGLVLAHVLIFGPGTNCGEIFRRYIEIFFELQCFCARKLDERRLWSNPEYRRLSKLHGRALQNVGRLQKLMEAGGSVEQDLAAARETESQLALKLQPAAYRFWKERQERLVAKREARLRPRLDRLNDRMTAVRILMTRIPNPSLESVQKWLNEVHRIDSEVTDLPHNLMAWRVVGLQTQLRKLSLALDQRQKEIIRSEAEDIARSNQVLRRLAEGGGAIDSLPIPISGEQLPDLAGLPIPDVPDAGHRSINQPAEPADNTNRLSAER